MNATPEQTAAQRVNSSETLTQYRDLLLNTDWPNWHEHLEWVATAPEAEIISWAEEIRRDEEAGDEAS